MATQVQPAELKASLEQVVRQEEAINRNEEVSVSE